MALNRQRLIALLHAFGRHVDPRSAQWLTRREVCHSSGRHLVVEEVESRVALSGAVLSINHRAGGRDLVEAVGTYRVGRSSSLARVLGWGLRGSTSDARPTRAERRTAELNKTDTWLRAAWPQNLWNP